MHITKQRFRTLDELLSSKELRGCIKFRSMVSSVRVDYYYGSLNIMYLHNTDRPSSYVKSSLRYQRTGELNRFLHHIDVVSTVKRLRVIRIEGVVNEFLPNALEGYGYSRYSRAAGVTDYQYML